MNSSRKLKVDYIDVIAHTFMILFSICILYPMVHILAISFSGSAAITSGKVTVFPVNFTIESYMYFFRHARVIRAFFNSVYYTATAVFLSLMFTSWAAYPMSKSNLIARSTVMKIFMFTMYFTGGTIPLYVQVTNMGLYDTHWAWILPGLMTTSNMIIMINGYRAVPTSLYEAAYLDGATDFQVYFKLAFPLAKATLASIGLFLFIGNWNSYFNAMLYLFDKDKFPLQLILRSMLMEGEIGEDMAEMATSDLTPIGVKNAMIVITMIPVLIVYPSVQKYFVKGVMIGSVKG